MTRALLTILRRVGLIAIPGRCCGRLFTSKNTDLVMIRHDDRCNSRGSRRRSGRSYADGRLQHHRPSQSLTSWPRSSCSSSQLVLRSASAHQSSFYSARWSMSTIVSGWTESAVAHPCRYWPFSKSRRASWRHTQISLDTYEVVGRLILYIQE